MLKLCPVCQCEFEGFIECPTCCPENARPGDFLRAAVGLFEQRNALYGDTFREFGHIAAALFRGGLHCRTVEDFARLGVFIHCVDKLARYAANFQQGGHPDSALDLCVYAAMLRSLTEGKQ